uniref:Putative secreted protein n=1 Tax=Amblyomma cajennense TaxID=34607 RepID=A0A023FD24_AMBCJ
MATLTILRCAVLFASFCERASTIFLLNIASPRTMPSKVMRATFFCSFLLPPTHQVDLQIELVVAAAGVFYHLKFVR